jgi:hypothetical protein
MKVTRRGFVKSGVAAASSLPFAAAARRRRKKSELPEAHLPSPWREEEHLSVGPRLRRR